MIHLSTNTILILFIILFSILVIFSQTGTTAFEGYSNKKIQWANDQTIIQSETETSSQYTVPNATNQSDVDVDVDVDVDANVDANVDAAKYVPNQNAESNNQSADTPSMASYNSYEVPDISAFNMDLLYNTSDLTQKYSFLNSSFVYKPYSVNDNEYLGEVFFNNNPLELERMCKGLDSNTCGLTSACVYIGNDKCLPGNKQGPFTNYSDINSDYYYYKGTCYGNCPGKLNSEPVISPTAPEPTTPEPTTPAPTTPAPTTPEPTTPAPTTPEPTTPAPTTPAPIKTTPAPTTSAPIKTTPAPTTSAPIKTNAIITSIATTQLTPAKTQPLQITPKITNKAV